MLYVIVAGWRGAKLEIHREVVESALYPIYLSHEPHEVTLRHGKCPYGGVDLIADRIARGWGWAVEEFPPEIRDGRVLGSPRNRDMCATRPRADVLVALPGPGSVGTWSCLRWATRYGIPSQIWPLAVTRWLTR